MELQFEKSVLPCLRWVTREVQNQEQTQEVRLTDGMPDIGSVLGSWGQIMIRGKEWRSGGMSVSGGVVARVLYAPEDGGQPQWVETWLPFQMKWDFSDTERDGAICVQPLLRGVDARSTSARKLMVRAGISILGEAAVPAEVEIYAPGEVPEDIQLLRNTYPVLLPQEAGEKSFLIDEVLSLPASMPQPEKLICYQVEPILAEQKVLGDKVVFRGTANLHLLYMGTDGQLHSWDFEMPFSQYAQLERDYAPEAWARVTLAVTSLELEQGEEDNYVWKTGVTGQYVIYDRPMVELVEDAYSTRRPVKPQTVKLTMPAVLDMQTLGLQAEQNLEFEGTALVDAVFYPEHPRLYREGDQVTAELGGVFQVLGYDSAGSLMGMSRHWEGSHEMTADQSAKLEASVQAGGKVRAALTGSTAAVSAQLPLDVLSTSGQALPMVTSLEVGELTEPDPNRPSLILRKPGAQSLWQMAKESGSTVDAIKNANALQQEPDPDRLLLIPVS